jgi:DNA-binding PucR family transcriptional regulator
VYLDNEMNLAQTAKDLFIHRSTLVARLKVITKAVDLTTPSNRMYIRYALYLSEDFESVAY